MHFTRLSGWQRLWVVASVLYAIPVMWFTQLQLGDVLGEPHEKRQWAYSAAELLADYVDVTTVRCNCDVVAHLFATDDNDEVIKRIYNIPHTHRALSPSTNTVKDPRDVERDCEQEVKKRRHRPAREAEKGFQMKSSKELGFPLGMGAEYVPQCKLEVLRSMIEHGKLTELKNFKLEEFKAQLVKLETDYKARLEKASKEKLTIVGIGFLAWILPIAMIYILGLAVGWVHRGFKEPRQKT